MTNQPRVANINFLIESMVTQTVTIIKDDLEPEDLVKGLVDGRYMTTINYDANNEKKEEIVYFDENDNDVAVAIIEKQRIAPGCSGFCHYELEQPVEAIIPF